MELTVHVQCHWAEESSDLAEAASRALMQYRDALKGLGADMCLVRVRCDLVNYGLLDDPAAIKEFTVDIDNGLAIWLEDLAASVNRNAIRRGGTIKGIVRVALRFYREHLSDLAARMEPGAKGAGGKNDDKV